MSDILNKFPVNIEDEMKRSYMDYAMSVIIGRALPDVRDGLKPAHRRVLYGMRTMGLASNRAYRKCAKIVGEVMGNYHPHGDASIYDTLVRLAQDFNMRYPLVDGQGNFGSVDGDPPAAMRYTEARPQGLAEAMMTDLDKETVDFVPNYDETTEEPTVLPAPFPNLLVNGSAGIAVGMATNVPPHNLREVCEGTVWLIEHGTGLTKEQKLRGLIERIPGPDFPTGGYIVGRSGIHEAYLSGRGAIQVRAKAEIENLKKGDRQQIVITEPWRREVVSVNRKANVFAQIAETMWVLAGRNDIEWLSAYLPRAVDYSDNGTHWRAGYGPRIRRIRGFENVDQLVRVVETLKADGVDLGDEELSTSFYVTERPTRELADLNRVERLRRRTGCRRTSGGGARSAGRRSCGRRNRGACQGRRARTASERAHRWRRIPHSR